MEALQLSTGGAACLRVQAKACVIAELEQGDEDNLSRGWRRSISAGLAACCSGAATPHGGYGFAACQRGRIPAAARGSALVHVPHFLPIT